MLLELDLMNEQQLLRKWQAEQTNLWLISTSPAPPTVPPGHLGATVTSFDITDKIVLKVEYANPPEFTIPVQGAFFLPQKHPSSGLWVLVIALSGRTDVLIELNQPAPMKK